MKQKIKIISFVAFCVVLIVTALYAGRGSYKNCDKCHFYSDKTK